MQMEFSHLIHKDMMYFHFHWLKSIHLSIIMLEKGSVINFAKNKTKTQRLKNKEIHKKFR